MADLDLRAFFSPRSIALIGASADPLKISARPLRMLAQHGYAGPVYPVNPKYTELLGRPAFPSIGAVPAAVDLALVAVPAPLVPATLEECAAAGVQHAVVLSSGFAECGPEGRRLQQAIADLTARSALRVCGPNSEGFFFPAAGVCATFSPVVDHECGFEPSPPGPIAVVSQSGGLGFAILHRGRERGLGFSAVVSTGNEVDLDWLDYVDHLLDEPSVRVVLGFLEGFHRPADRLVEVARKAAGLRKPLVVAKVGRSEVAGRAAAAHTGSQVGSEAAYSAAFRQLGILRVDDLDEMLDVATYLCVGRLPAGRRVAVLTTSGGAGAWLADRCAAHGLELPPPEPELEAEIRSFIPAYGSTFNPIDITAQAVFSGGFERALGLLTRSPRFDAVACVSSLVREEPSLRSLPELRRATEASDTPVVFYSYTRPSQAVIAGLAELGIPCYPTPDRAARALAWAARYRAFLDRADQVAVLAGPQPRSSTGPLGEDAVRAYLEPLATRSPADGATGIALVLSARRDPQLGPLVQVGLSGPCGEVLGDEPAVHLAPVSEVEARELLEEWRGWAVLRGGRDRPAADVDALARAVARVSELAAGLPPSVSSVEINPLLVLPAGQGVLMLDAAVARPEGAPE